MNIGKMDVKRLVFASRSMDEAIKSAIAYKETIDEIIKKVVEKDGTLTYMYEE